MTLRGSVLEIVLRVLSPLGYGAASGIALGGVIRIAGYVRQNDLIGRSIRRAVPTPERAETETAT